MTAEQERTSPPAEQQPTNKVEPVQGGAVTKKSSPAVMTKQDWTAEQLARAPKLTKSRLAKVRQLVIG